MFRFFTRFPFPIRAGGAPYVSAALRQFTKNRKSAVSHPASPYAVAMPHRSPCASDPHTDNIPIPPQSDHVPAETSAPAYANQAPTGLLKLPAAATACSPPPASTSAYGAASRRCVGVNAVGARVQAGPKTGACGADPRGTGAGRTRQKSADAASGQSDPQDERQTTQAAGQARRHAGAWVRSFHFPTLSRIS